MEVFGLDWWSVVVAGISTLAIYSFLYKENFFYRFFEHFYIGIATGFGIVAGFRNFLWPKVFKPLFGLDRLEFPDGTMSAEYNEMQLLMLLPMAVGLLYYFILSKRLSWIAQIPIGVGLGFAGGLAFKGTITEILPQIEDTFRPIFVIGDAAQTLTNIFFMLTFICALTYFFFTFKRGEGGVVEKGSAFGRWLMMGCFGAFFGSTIMARMALLVERLDFLINQWVVQLNHAVAALIAGGSV